MDYENLVGLAAAAAVLGFLWSIKSDIVGVHRAIAEVHRDMAKLTERIAKIEVFIEWFKERLDSESRQTAIAGNPNKPESHEPD